MAGCRWTLSAARFYFSSIFFETTCNAYIMMIEVFKTNVRHRAIANMLIDRIHETCSHYKATFDLEDCDRILRVKSSTDELEPQVLISILEEFGFHAEVLPMEDQPADPLFRLSP